MKHGERASKTTKKRKMLEQNRKSITDSGKGKGVVENIFVNASSCREQRKRHPCSEERSHGGRRTTNVMRNTRNDKMEGST